MACVLLVEDEVSIAESLIYALETEHFDVKHVTTGAEAMAFMEMRRSAGDLVDLAILDVGLPDRSGFDLCRDMQLVGKLPVIFLTARDSEIDRILGLELGGDDYVTKPFSPREVVARVRAVLRRVQPQAVSLAEEPVSSKSPADVGLPELERQAEIDWPVEAGAFSHNELAKTVKCCGVELVLTAHEYKLLAVLLSQPGRIFSRDQLLTHAWDDPGSAMDRTVDAHIKSLRAKIRKACESELDYIETRRGLGYTMKP
ncbi:two-component system response regulator CreB [Persicirhabdus sediminis]|uniref:Two-component system response regulator CreB n=1 Tax=Persicirhabdus sediminis TaxID=454144 RepID=A0A8J7MBX2_9BACT|nr:two-component system response regulator CreB [Persicirhabdus sediminis]MBK1789562.1 two-component system response regulator CreB [Persicirhabdus sediminis]